MTWGNPPKLTPSAPKPSKPVTPEQLAGNSEHSQQVALFAWAALNVGKYPALAYMFAIPNGGLRDVRTATNLKAEGVKAGVPDIFLPFAAEICWMRSSKYHGLFLELKVKKNKPTLEQSRYMCALESEGYLTKICYTWEEARDTILNYLEGRL